MTAKTAFVKYVFLDVVGFTKNRSVEAQSEIINQMNLIVEETLLEHKIPKKKLIVLPSGDGLCIALIELLNPYDIHILLALGILKRLDDYNSKTTDQSRRFHLRIGINENVDNLIIDYNGRPNVAGAGINIAQFTMNQADGNQILVAENVFSTLRHREHYSTAFRQYKASGKHGQIFNVYQYINHSQVGLNVEIPVFVPKPPVRPTLSILEGCYFAHAQKNRETLLEKLKTPVAFYALEYASIILLYFLACDSLELIESPSYGIKTYLTWSAGKASFEEQLDYYCNIHLSLLRLYSEEIINKHLRKFYDYFESLPFARFFLLNDKGIEKLKNDCPDIWKEFFGNQGHEGDG